MDVLFLIFKFFNTFISFICSSGIIKLVPNVIVLTDSFVELSASFVLVAGVYKENIFVAILFIFFPPFDLFLHGISLMWEISQLFTKKATIAKDWNFKSKNALNMIFKEEPFKIKTKRKMKKKPENSTINLKIAIDALNKVKVL